jgi:hypothetical protein
MSFQLFDLRFLVTDNGQLFPDQVSHFCTCACGLVLASWPLVSPSIDYSLNPVDKYRVKH